MLIVLCFQDWAKEEWSGGLSCECNDPWDANVLPPESSKGLSAGNQSKSLHVQQSLFQSSSDSFPSHLCPSRNSSIQKWKFCHYVLTIMSLRTNWYFSAEHKRSFGLCHTMAVHKVTIAVKLKKTHHKSSQFDSKPVLMLLNALWRLQIQSTSHIDYLYGLGVKKLVWRRKNPVLFGK